MWKVCLVSFRFFDWSFFLNFARKFLHNFAIQVGVSNPFRLTNLLILLQCWLVEMTRIDDVKPMGELTTCNSSLAYRQISQSRHQVALALWLISSHGIIFSTLCEYPKYTFKKIYVWKLTPILIEAKKRNQIQLYQSLKDKECETEKRNKS